MEQSNGNLSSDSSCDLSSLSDLSIDSDDVFTSSTSAVAAAQPSSSNNAFFGATQPPHPSLPPHLTGTSTQLRHRAPISRRRRNTISQVSQPSPPRSNFSRDVLRSTPREDESWDDIYGDADRTRDEEERAERARLRRINEGTSMTDDFHFLSNTWRTLYKKECDQWPLRRRTLHYAIQCKIPMSEVSDHWHGMWQRMWDEKQGLVKLAASLRDLKMNRKKLKRKEKNNLQRLYKEQDILLASLSHDRLNEAQFVAREKRLANITSEVKTCEHRLSNLDKATLEKAIEDVGCRVKQLVRALERGEGWMYMNEDPVETKEFEKLICRFAYSLKMPTAEEPPLLPPYSD
ncbi:uncharacterized protein LOC142340770 [Convolutriloba macropyga]|uniref:uncharacterized protein LOC142340770 n=1 Tax=Convolutriloba macropyga TaxID=536237 RepID=UPI003F52210E